MRENSEAASDAGASILLVDDDERILTVLKRALETPGFHVSAVASASAALSELARQTFDVVVSDILMPRMNGLKLLHAVREHDLDLPVVLMTGNPDLKTAAAAVEYGAFQYLIKPVEVDRLRAVVQRAVNVGKMARLKRECAQEFGSGSFYVGDRAGIEAKLNLALSSLWVAYQPIVRASDSTTFGYEALMRSEEPVLPNPTAVLKAAEKARRVHDVGRAVRDLVALDAAARAGHLVFVNLHPEDLMDPALYLPTAPLTRLASSVVLEFTDRGSLAEVSDVAERFRRLRALGYRIAIDDLGAGSGDPAMLNQLEPDFVKLDLKLTRSIDVGPAKAKLVGAIVRVCHEMGVEVVGKGVETATQRDTLVSAGCDFLQGYLLGRPGRLA